LLANFSTFRDNPGGYTPRPTLSWRMRPQTPLDVGNICPCTHKDGSSRYINFTWHGLPDQRKNSLAWFQRNPRYPQKHKSIDKKYD
jgi:hypothetical protein